MNKANCPLCRSDASYNTEVDAPHTYNFECEVCGDFDISDCGYDPIIDPQSPDIAYGKVSAWTRQESDSGRIAEVNEATLKNPPKIFDGLSVESKIIRALQTIAQKWPVPGTNINLGNSEWPLFCDSGTEECSWIFKTLFARGYIEEECETFLDGNFWLQSGLTAKAWAELEAAKTKFQQHNLCFVAMRFVKEFDPLFESMRRACNRAGYECKRVDTDPHADHIDYRLIDLLKRCRFVIADFTEDSRNVYFEAGYAHGMSKQVIWTRRAGQMWRLIRGSFISLIGKIPTGLISKLNLNLGLARWSGV